MESLKAAYLCLIFIHVGQVRAADDGSSEWIVGAAVAVIRKRPAGQVEGGHAVKTFKLFNLTSGCNAQGVAGSDMRFTGDFLDIDGDRFEYSMSLTLDQDHTAQLERDGADDEMTPDTLLEVTSNSLPVSHQKCH